MIIIKAKGHEFKYKGDIELTSDEAFIWVKAYLLSPANDEEFVTSQDCLVFDAFWIEDVYSIVGID